MTKCLMSSTILQAVKATTHKLGTAKAGLIADNRNEVARKSSLLAYLSKEEE